MSGPVDPTLNQPDPQSGTTPVEAGLDALDSTAPEVEPSPSDTDVDWKKRYNDSRRGVQELQQRTRAEVEAERQARLATEQQNQMLQFQMLQLAQQRAQPAPQPQPPAEYISATEAKEIADATLEGDYARAQRIQNTAISRAVQQVQFQQVVGQAQGAQIASGLQRVKQLVPEFGEDSTLSSQIVFRAQQMRMSDPGLTEIGALREAAADYALWRNRALAGAQDRVRASADTQDGERGSQGGSAIPGASRSTGFNPQTHLSTEERDYVSKRAATLPGYSPKKYWEAMSKGEREARLKKGGPLSREESRQYRRLR